MITYLRWRDATYLEREHQVYDVVDRLQLVETVGTFVQETEMFITIALDCFPSEDPHEYVAYRYLACIPKSCIERRMDFELPVEDAHA